MRFSRATKALPWVVVFLALGVRADSWDQAVASLADDLLKANDLDEYGSLFSRPFDFQEEAVHLKALNVVLPSPKRDVLEAYSDVRALKRSKRFIKEHPGAFSWVLFQCNVPPTAVTAILYVESLLGHYKPKEYPTLPTLISLAALSNRAFRQEQSKVVFQKAQSYDPRSPWNEPSAWEKRLKDIGEQWREELRLFLTLSKALGWSLSKVTSVHGSWVGAFGYGQMLPSTAFAKLRHHGSFDPWKWEDAIRLTGIELMEKNWSDDPRGAIFEYNRAQWYVDAVWNLHEKLSEYDIRSWVTQDPSSTSDSNTDVRL